MELIVKQNNYRHLVIIQIQADLILILTKILAGIAFNFFLIDVCLQMHIYIHL